MDGAGNMAGLPGAHARVPVAEVEAAVKHQPVRIGQPGGEFAGGHQGRMRQASALFYARLIGRRPAIAIAVIVIKDPAIANAMSFCPSHTSPWVPR